MTTELRGKEKILYEYAVIPPERSLQANPGEKTTEKLLEERINGIFLNEIEHILAETKGGHSEQIFLGDYQVTSIQDGLSESAQGFQLTHVGGLEDAKKKDREVEIDELVDLLKQDLGFKGGKAPKSPMRRPHCKIWAAGQSPMTNDPFPIFRLVDPPKENVYTFLKPLSLVKHYYSAEQLLNAKASGGEYHGFSKDRTRAWSDNKPPYYTAHYRHLEEKRSSNTTVPYYQQVKCSDDDLGHGLKDFYFDYEAFNINKSTFVANTYKPVSAIAATAIAGNVLFFHFVSLQDLRAPMFGAIPVVLAEVLLLYLLVVSISAEFTRQQDEYFETACIQRDPESIVLT